MKIFLFTILLAFKGICGFVIPVFSLDELLNPSKETEVRIFKAVTEIGMLSIRNDHSAALLELVSCVQSGRAIGHTQDVTMKDETVRTTLAVSTNHSQSLPFQSGLIDQCPLFVQKADGLRAAAAAVGQAYAQFLDRMDRSNPSAYHLPGPFEAAVTVAESLEHFHVFRRRDEQKQGAQPTLHMHTDLGLFIVMTAPQYYDLQTSSKSKQVITTGFRLQLPDGNVVSPEFPADSLLVMNGEGGARWVESSVSDKLYVPPHEVILPPMSGLGRAWYGRMYLPPRSSKQQQGNKGQTFNRYWTEGRDSVMQSISGMVPVPFIPSHRELLVDQGNCSSGELYCWMTCMKTTNVSTCAKEQIVCTDPNGQSWPEKFINASTGKPTHCFSCTLRCNNTNAALNFAPKSTLILTVALILASLLH